MLLMFRKLAWSGITWSGIVHLDVRLAVLAPELGKPGALRYIKTEVAPRVYPFVALLEGGAAEVALYVPSESRCSVCRAVCRDK
jgi:hypothetical protein